MFEQANGPFGMEAIKTDMISARTAILAAWLAKYTSGMMDHTKAAGEKKVLRQRNMDVVTTMIPSRFYLAGYVRARTGNRDGGVEVRLNETVTHRFNFVARPL